MPLPKKLSAQEIDKFLDDNRAHALKDGAIERTYTFPTYGEGLGFAVAVGFAADKRDHHPDLLVRFAKVTVRWSTHDVDGISELDIEMARAVDALYTRAS